MAKIVIGPRSGMNWVPLSTPPTEGGDAVLRALVTDVEAHHIEPEEVTVDATHARTNGKPVPVGRHRSN
ncbi:hypothetical protein [Nocardia pseudovaccinii]|uniref:hypothetical protein n=1 Tax=Nocardia pseudovaccinii TaxID=189540 RepID=UPI0007A3DD2C|nr:hypothetical protein [Nocardia pseudovaccinii]